MPAQRPQQRRLARAVPAHQPVTAAAQKDHCSRDDAHHMSSKLTRRCFRPNTAVRACKAQGLHSNLVAVSTHSIRVGVPTICLWRGGPDSVHALRLDQATPEAHGKQQRRAEG
jgi:hypothetical protein